MFVESLEPASNVYKGNLCIHICYANFVVSIQMILVDFLMYLILTEPMNVINHGKIVNKMWGT